MQVFVPLMSWNGDRKKQQPAAQRPQPVANSSTKDWHLLCMRYRHRFKAITVPAEKFSVLSTVTTICNNHPSSKDGSFQQSETLMFAQ